MQDDIKTAVENLTRAADALDDALSGPVTQVCDRTASALNGVNAVRRDLLALVEQRPAPPAMPVDEQVIGVGNGREVRGTRAACQRVEELVRRAENAVNLNVRGQTVYGPYDAMRYVKDAIDRAGAATGLQQVIDEVRDYLNENTDAPDELRKIVGVPLPARPARPPFEVSRARIKATADSVAMPIHGVYVLSESEVEQVVDRCVAYLREAQS